MVNIRGLFYSSVSTSYGVATISRLHQMRGLFCKRALQKRLYSAKETYNFRGLFYSSVSGSYGVATISRLLQMRGLFCKRAL